MSDWLLEISRRPWARGMYNRLPLPVRLPPDLRRESGPWGAEPLLGAAVRVEAAGEGRLAGGLRSLLEKAGARAGGEEAPHGLVLDATGVREAAELRAVYDFFHRSVRNLLPSGRAIVVGLRADRLEDPGACATHQALQGFVRSLGKELGRRGATAQLLALPPGGSAEDRLARLAGPLAFFLSPRSAYVSGQVVSLSARTPLPESLSPPEVRPLAGRRVVLTGAAGGIGAAMAAAFAREGASVLGVDHPTRQAVLERTMATLGGTAVGVDLASDAGIAAVAERARELWGGVDVVVNNAGITRDRTLAKMPAEAWDAVLNVNLEAPARLTEALEPVLADGGRLVFLSSVAGIAGNLGQTNYAASKAGLLGLVARLAPRLASRGITVNALAPGLIETEMMAKIPVVIREMGRRMNSLGQAGLPQDVAEAAVFLASPGAFAVTGGALRICGQSLFGA